MCITLLKLLSSWVGLGPQVTALLLSLVTANASQIFSLPLVTWWVMGGLTPVLFLLLQCRTGGAEERCA